MTVVILNICCGFCFLGGIFILVKVIRFIFLTLIFISSNTVVFAESFDADSFINSIGIPLLIAFSFLSLLFFVITVVLIVRAEKYKLQSKINKMTDLETGVGNIAFFKLRFNEILQNASKNLNYTAYIILDSHYLKTYHGDSTFEDVVKYTADTLSKHASKHECVARITENGFAFLFQHLNPTGAEIRMRAIIKELNGILGEDEKVSKPIFHSSMCHVTSKDSDPEILLFNLRRACSRIFGHSEQLIICDSDILDRAQEEKEMVESIKKAFDNNEFKLYLQFVVDAKTKKISSAEGLSRWDNKEKGIISPGKYLSVMEHTGLISRFDFYMLDKVCEWLAGWKGTKYENVPVSCNFTRFTISEDKFIEKFKSIIEKYDFERSNLVIEITEDMSERNRERAMKNIYECKKLGCVVALDDMGCGYTSLINLCDYPIDIVKIDRDILLRHDTPNGKALFKGIVALAHSLNLKVVSEGVESELQNKFIEETDCDYIQGFLFSKVHESDNAEAFIDNYINSDIYGNN